MSPYQVEWDAVALKQLARIWLASLEPGTITADQAEVDRLLARDPFQHGWHVSEGLHGIRVGSLFVNFTVEVDARIVNVTWVRLCV
jgi:hypothetical protein